MLSAAQCEILKIEENISKLCAERNCEIVSNFTKNLGTLNGNFSQLGMWKLKNQLVPKDVDPPMAKQDKHGNLITAPEALKNLYLETYVERLKHREIRPELKNNYLKKMELWEMRFSHLRTRSTDAWTKKNNNSRDPAGLINEIFKPPVMVRDLEDALLQLINGIQKWSTFSHLKY